MNGKHFLYVLAAIAILAVAACAPQGGAKPTATSVPDAAPAQASAAATSPSNVEAQAEPAVNTTPAPTTQASQASPTERPSVGQQAWIAYQTDRTGDVEGVWLIHPDGTEDHQIAADIPGSELLPDWSPDGTRLVVTTRGRTTEPLYEYDLTTNTSRQLFECAEPCAGDDEPAYSPDGTQVAFIRALLPFVYSKVVLGNVPSDCGIWIGDIATGQVRQITSNTDPPCDNEMGLRWSPDGSQFTYWRDRYENYQRAGTAVFVINVDGSNERRLTDPELFAGEPDWSPDGEWIIFDTYPLHEFDAKVSNLYRMHPDGSGLEQLTHYETPDLRATQPRYTPDGRWIVFTAVTSSSRSLWAIPAEGGEPMVLAQGGIYTHGTWQP